MATPALIAPFVAGLLVQMTAGRLNISRFNISSFATTHMVRPIWAGIAGSAIRECFSFRFSTEGCMRRLLAHIGFLTISALLGSPVLAQTATTQFNVQITINAECQINSATDLNFGSTGVIDTAVAATNAIAVQCTNGTTYDIGLNAGQNPGATVAARLMTGPGAQTVTYSLFTDTAHTDVWGNTIGGDTVAGTGTGSAQTYTVFGQVPAQQTPSPGTYNDVITVTVTY